MRFKDAKVVVAGATGLIGSNLIRRLLDEGATVRGTLHHKSPVIDDTRIEFVHCDLTTAEGCACAVSGMQYVFLCAAVTSGAAAIAATPMIHVTPNILINAQMLEAAYNAGVEKFIWLGSTVAYPVTPKPVKEDELWSGEPFEKYFFAGWAKRFMEVMCRMYGEKLAKTMTTIVLRPTNVYGPNDDFEFATSHVIPALIRKSVERWDPIEVWGDGSEVRDAIYVDDMVEAMLQAGARLDSYAVINIGLGRGYSVRDILQMILEEDGYTDARIRYDASKPTMIPFRLVDTSKAEAVLGFKAQTDLREGLRKTIDWYRAARNLPRPQRAART
jgi:GDP-L-fucose synthase